jgi:hypothetical protein
VHLWWPAAALRAMGAGASAQTWRWKRTKRLPKYVDVDDDYIRPAGHIVLGQVLLGSLLMRLFLLYMPAAPYLGCQADCLCPEHSRWPCWLCFAVQDPSGNGQFIKMTERPLMTLIHDSGILMVQCACASVYRAACRLPVATLAPCRSSTCWRAGIAPRVHRYQGALLMCEFSCVCARTHTHQPGA